MACSLLQGGERYILIAITSTLYKPSPRDQAILWFPAVILVIAGLGLLPTSLTLSAGLLLAGYLAWCIAWFDAFVLGLTVTTYVVMLKGDVASFKACGNVLAVAAIVWIVLTIRQALRPTGSPPTRRAVIAHRVIGIFAIIGVAVLFLFLGAVSLIPNIGIPH